MLHGIVRTYVILNEHKKMIRIDSISISLMVRHHSVNTLYTVLSIELQVDTIYVT